MILTTTDRDKYLETLHQCDLLAGEIPFDGANASLEQVKPLVDYIAVILEKKLETLIKLVKGEIPDFVEAKDDPVNDPVNDPVYSGLNDNQKEVFSLIRENPHINYDNLAEKTKHSRATIKRIIKQLKQKNKIERIGSDKTGYRKVR